MKSAIRAARSIVCSNNSRCCFASASSSAIRLDFHQLGCAEFTQRMRQNLSERKSEANLDEMLQLYQRFQSGEKDLQPRLEHLYLSLPNFSHPKTQKDLLTPFYFTVRRPKSEVDLLSNVVASHQQGDRPRKSGLGTLRSSGALGNGCGARAYAFYDSLAILESALIRLTLDRACKAGFQLVTVPDLLPSFVIQRCGFPITGHRNQIFKVARRKGNDAGDGVPFCLSGTAEMGLASFCSDRVVGGAGATEAEFLCAVSRCFRQEIAPRESLLYRTHQFTKVELFCVAKPSAEVGDRILEKIVEFQKSLYSDLELHFRVLEMPTTELGNSAHRKIDIEAFMPGEGIFGEISSASNCTDYQAIRLNILWRQASADGSYPYAYTLNGTGCAVTRCLKALVETHQNDDGSIDIPPVLWPYTDGVRKLQMEQSPLVTL